MVTYETKIKILSNHLFHTQSCSDKAIIYLQRPDLVGPETQYNRKLFLFTSRREPLLLQGWKQLRDTDAEKLRQFDRAWEVKFVNEVH